MVKTDGTKRILTVASYYLPGYKAGGPITTISSMVEHFGDHFEFLVMTRNHDANEAHSYEDVSQTEWMEVGKAKVRYLTKKQQTLLQLERIIQAVNPDILYLNSLLDPIIVKILFLRRFKRLGDVSVLIAPRGELFPAALSVKPRKKKPFLVAARIFDLYSNVSFHASTSLEAEIIEKKFPYCADKHIFIAPNMAARLPTRHAPERPTPKMTGHAQIVFLSRITPIKNLTYALRVLCRVEGELTFDIYGPKEGEAYWAECQALIGQLPANVRATYHGSVAKHKVFDMYVRSHAFLLPTQTENFGHVIIEGMSAGCIPIISNQTPWRGLADKGVGWDLPLDDEDSFVDAVNRVIAMNDTEFRAISYAAWSYADSILKNEATFQANIDMFNAI